MEVRYFDKKMNKRLKKYLEMASRESEHWEYNQMEVRIIQYSHEAFIMDNMSRCFNCHKEEKEMKTCGRCKAAKYCSRDCQKSDWKTHRMMCDFYQRKHTKKYVDNGRKNYRLGIFNNGYEYFKFVSEKLLYHYHVLTEN